MEGPQGPLHGGRRDAKRTGHLVRRVEEGRGRRLLSPPFHDLADGRRHVVARAKGVHEVFVHQGPSPQGAHGALRGQAAVSVLDADVRHALQGLLRPARPPAQPQDRLVAVAPPEGQKRADGEIVPGAPADEGPHQDPHPHLMTEGGLDGGGLVATPAGLWVRPRQGRSVRGRHPQKPPIGHPAERPVRIGNGTAEGVHVHVVEALPRQEEVQVLSLHPHLHAVPRGVPANQREGLGASVVEGHLPFPLHLQGHPDA